MTLPGTVTHYPAPGLTWVSAFDTGTSSMGDAAVRVEHNSGATQAKVISLRLEMPCDDGTTWHPVPSVRSGSGWMATVFNPRTAGFVSLRATATDASGTTVKQTVIRGHAVIS